MIIRNNQTKGGLIRLGYFSIFLVVLATFFSFNHKEKSKISNVYEFGKASYYGKPFIGRKTANGEIFTEFEYTCAHKTLPFGTKLKVTNLANNQSIIVRVNDRGPFVKSRILDLSIQGAKELGLMQSGIANITVEIVHGKLSSLGNTNRMERIAVDDMYAYVDINDDKKLDQVYAYLQETDQLGYNNYETVVTNPVKDSLVIGTSNEPSTLEVVK
jgi:rare lipoprotein A (peptidoglycan hydrolase)